jgi:hypothetical protein
MSMLGDLRPAGVTRLPRRVRVDAPASPRRRSIGGPAWDVLDAHERQVALVRASLLLTRRPDRPTHRRWA